MYIYTYIYRGWGVLNQEIVSFRSCVRSRGLVAWWNWISKVAGQPFPFSLFAMGSFPFSLGPPLNLLSNFSWAYR